MASFPTAPVVFPTRVDGQTIFAQHVNALQDEVAALEAYFLPGGGGGSSQTSPLTITGADPALVLDTTGNLASSRVIGDHLAQANLSVNAGLDGAGVNWNADDVAAQSVLLQLQAATGRAVFSAAPVSANPRVMTPTVIIEPTGALRERNRATPMGEWIDIAYAAGNFTASGAMVWTVDPGDQAFAKYMLIGKTCYFSMDIATTTLGGTASTNLNYLGLVGKVIPAVQIVVPVWVSQSGGAVQWGTLVTNPGSSILALYQTPNTTTAWVLGAANATRVNVNCSFPIQ